MRVETLALGNRILTTIKLIEASTNHFQYRPSEMGITGIDFLQARYEDVRHEATTKIQNYLKEVLQDLNSFLTGLCDETCPIILPAYEKYVETHMIQQEEEDEDGEHPVKRKITKWEFIQSVSAAKTSICPEGGVFGEDNDEFDECNECKLWQKCYNHNKPKAKRKL